MEIPLLYAIVVTSVTLPLACHIKALEGISEALSNVMAVIYLAVKLPLCTPSNMSALRLVLTVPLLIGALPFALPNVYVPAVIVPAFIYTGRFAAPTVEDDAVAVPELRYIGFTPLPTVAEPSFEATSAVPLNVASTKRLIRVLADNNVNVVSVGVEVFPVQSIVACNAKRFRLYVTY